MNDLSDESRRGRGSVMMVLATAHGQFGGTEKNALELARVLVKRGVKVIILEVGQPLLAKHGSYTGATFELVVVDSFDEVTRREWMLRLERLNPDVILRVKGWFGSQNRALDLVALCHAAVYLSWEQHPSARDWSKRRTGVLNKLKATARGALHRLAVKQTLAISRAVREPLLTLQGFASSRVDLIYPGVDFNTFAHSPEARSALRAAWGVPPDAFVVGYLGRLVPHKRVDLVLETFAVLRSRDEAAPLWCVIAGVGVAQVELAGIADRLGISSRVRFVGWQDSAPSTLSAIDLFLMPSTDEGLGLTLIEAAGSSCLTIGSNEGGMQEVMDGALSGYQVDCNAGVAAWVEACDRLLSNSPEDLERLRTQFRADMMRKFDASRQWNATADWVGKYLPRR